MQKPIPKQIESPFSFQELFFSVTDKRGIIRFGNDVFVRVSAYPKETMLGAPHSIVRHPDMPRAVFKVFWDILKKNNPVGAYVKNLSGNGNYYWVFAFAFPLEDGYLSIRFKPSSAIFTKVQEIYTEVWEYEKAHDDLNASHAFLLEKVKAAGYPDYEHFMVGAAMEELKSRSEKCRTEKSVSQKDSNHSQEQNQSGLAQISQVSEFTSKKLMDTFEVVRGFQRSNDIFSTTIESLGTGFQSLKFISINMKIAAAKFGEAAISLGVVSNEFSLVSQRIETHLSGLSNFINTLSDIIQQCMLRIAGLNSQTLIVDFFVKESIAKLKHSHNAFSEMIQNQKNFSGLFKEYCLNLKTEIFKLDTSLNAIEQEMSEVNKFVTGLEVIRQIGAVESARSDDIKSTFSHYLSSMEEFIQLLRGATIKIHHEVNSLSANSGAIADSASSLVGNIDTIFSLASAFEVPEQEQNLPSHEQDLPIGA